MTPGEASKQSKPIEIQHPIGMERYPAQLFDLPEGIAWIEYGWVEGDAPGSPIHRVEGIVAQTTSEQEWTMATRDGTVTIRILSEDNPKDRELINRMAQYRKGDREKARQIIQSDLNIKIPPQ